LIEFIRVWLQCLVEASDKEIYERLIAGGGSHFVAQRAELILREVHRYSLRTRAECLVFLGELLAGGNGKSCSVEFFSGFAKWANPAAPFGKDLPASRR
jgi:hypothetical protein